MNFRYVLASLAAVGLLGLAGCSCCGKKPCSNPPGPPYPHPPGSAVTAPPGQPLLTTPPPGATIYPATPGGPPAGAAIYPASPGTPPPPAFPATPPPGATNGTRYYGPVVPAPANPWQPTANDPVRLSPPDTSGLNKTAYVPDEGGVQTAAKLTVDSATLTPALPVGIPQFAFVEPRLGAGLKPDIDGLDWLRGNGFRTVIHVRAVGEDDSADRKQVEKRGMKFISVESPATVPSRQDGDAFTRLLRNSADAPIFVYDRDGALAGSFWYLHFRVAERFPEDEARLRAVRLGLKTEGDRQAVWQALQQIAAQP